MSWIININATREMQQELIRRVFHSLALLKYKRLATLNFQDFSSWTWDEIAQIELDDLSLKESTLLDMITVRNS